jgi:hypothetical protein
MHLIARLRAANWNKIALVFFPIMTALLAGRLVSSESYKILALLLFSGAVLVLYLTHFEFFILFVLILNQELFNFLPREPLGSATYQDLLYVVLLTTGGWYFLRKKAVDKKNFSLMVIAFLGIVTVAVFNSYFQGQPILLGLKAAKGNFLFLFYFVFLTKNIDTKKLFRIIVITGVVLAAANNIQYIFFGELKIFQYSQALERAGQLRFLIGDFFTIFAPIIALSEYLTARKKAYLLAFIYMLGTVVVQGKTRGVIWGFLATILLLLYFSKRINFAKTVLIGVPVASILIWLGPAIQSSFVSEIYDLTKREFSEKSGNVGIRFEAYEYYFGEIRKSPFIGRGIWNEAFDAYLGDNPENMEEKGIFLSDIGMMDIFFRYGLMGIIWLLLLFKIIYKLTFMSAVRLKEQISLAIIGYFVFCFSTMPTLNCLLSLRTTVYLALILVLIDQQNRASQDHEERLEIRMLPSS